MPAPVTPGRQGVGEAVGVAQGAGEVEGLVELGLGQGDLGVGLEHLAEGPALLPGRPGVALDDAVGLVAGQPGRRPAPAAPTG